VGEAVIAFHFTQYADRLRDGRPLPAIGEWLVHDGPVWICESGLHYSLDPFDALQYAQGPYLHLVDVEDIVEAQDDKGVCRRRKILQSADATEMLCYFARMQALLVVHLWGAPDVVLDYLMTGDESIRDAAWAAARAAAGAAAWAAARDAAWAAAGAAAGAAAWAAAGAAARDVLRPAVVELQSAAHMLADRMLSVTEGS
jgi:hypothetical protein